MQIGDYSIDGQVMLAPMSGVSDRPCREISVDYGAALATTEMLTSDPKLWASHKSKSRLDFTGNPGLVSVQIAGASPDNMAYAARLLVERGAQVIDINLGCPAKKVCGAASGSALLTDLDRVRDLFKAVVGAVDVPVTVKTRTGWDSQTPTAVTVAQMAQAEGLAAFALHGRARSDFYNGQAEHDTLKRVREAIDIPLIANGDINSPEKARQVLEQTGADAVMVGRWAQGNPWLLEHMDRHLRGLPPRAVTHAEKLAVVRRHVARLEEFYGPVMGPRFARKHIKAYAQPLGWSRDDLSGFLGLEHTPAQLDWLAQQAA